MPRRTLPPAALTRRTFLQGTGAVIALPFLESLLPRAARAASTATAAPTRYISYYVPLGMMMDAWVPTTTGAGYTLSPTLQPLAAYVGDFTVISGTDNTMPNQPNPGVGGHAKGTGQYPSSTRISALGTAAKTAVSADQVVAQAIGSATRLQSLQLAIGDEDPYSDSGYDANYTYAISWNTPTTPMTPVATPSLTFNTLFPSGQVQGQTASKVVLTAQRAVAPSTQKSILDAALAQASALQAKMGVADRQILDQYLTSVREVEQSIASTTTTPAATSAACVVPSTPSVVSKADYDTKFTQFAQLMPLAFACDQTRVISFMFARGESGRIYKNLGVSAGWHSISHYGTTESGMNKAQNIATLKKIQLYEMQCFAKLLGNLKAIGEGSGTLLDNTVIFFSSELSDSNDHTNTNMPVLIAGGGSGRLKARGQHIAMPTTPTAKANTSYAQTLLTAIRATGVSVDTIGTTGETNSIAGML